MKKKSVKKKKTTKKVSGKKHPLIFREKKNSATASVFTELDGVGSPLPPVAY